mmetsp:Transcript_2822/g.7056  ORF Transcript_2822/g.7056 Transcript_2822/m.7056 type:complete len:283 (+) Transcript_2822:391-1239(+)
MGHRVLRVARGGDSRRVVEHKLGCHVDGHHAPVLRVVHRPGLPGKDMIELHTAALVGFLEPFLAVALAGDSGVVPGAAKVEEEVGAAWRHAAHGVLRGHQQVGGGHGAVLLAAARLRGADGFRLVAIHRVSGDAHAVAVREAVEVGTPQRFRERLDVGCGMLAGAVVTPHVPGEDGLVHGEGKVLLATAALQNCGDPTVKLRPVLHRCSARCLPCWRGRLPCPNVVLPALLQLAGDVADQLSAAGLGLNGLFPGHTAGLRGSGAFYAEEIPAVVAAGVAAPR